MEERFFTVLLFALSFNFITSETQQQQRHQNVADLGQGSGYSFSGNDGTDDVDHMVTESTEAEGSGNRITDRYPDVEYSALTPCQRQQLAPMSTDAFRPQCTSSGEFRQTQCDSKRCWCVDADGVKTSSAEVLLPKKPKCNRRRRPEIPVLARTQSPLGAVGPDFEGRNTDDITIEEASTFRPVDTERVTSRKMRKMQSTAGPGVGFESSDVSEKVPAPTFLSLIFDDPLIFAGIVGGVVLALLCIVLLVMFTIYRMRKKDEGSYALEEPKKSYGFAYTRARDKEFFA